MSGWLDKYKVDTAKNGKWIQGAINPEHKGYCTPMTKSTCTPRRKAFAETMKKHHGFHKAADGTNLSYIDQPVTQQDRSKWNQYQSVLTSAPGQFVRNWDHNQDFQKQTAQQVGYDYNKNAAIQSDMQQNPNNVSGIQGNDAWGGNPNWVGGRESRKAYKQHEYVHLDKNNREIGHLQPSFTQLTGDQFNDWSNYNRRNDWQSNDQGVAMPTEQPWTPQPIAINNQRQQQNNWHTGESADYSINSVRQGQSDEDEDDTMENGGKVTPPPIYVDSRNDPRYKAYNDSLNAFKLNPLIKESEDNAINAERLFEQKLKERGHKIAHGLDKDLDIIVWAEREKYFDSRKKYVDNIISDYIYPMSDNKKYGTTNSYEPLIHGRESYKEPVQPVVYKARDKQNIQKLSISEINKLPTNIQEQPVQEIDPFQDANYSYQGNGTFVPDEYHKKMGYPNKTDKMKKGGKLQYMFSKGGKIKKKM